MWTSTKNQGSLPDPSRPLYEALHEQQEWLRITLSSIGDGVIAIDTQGDVTFLNAVAQSLTGWTQDAAVGKPLDTVFQVCNEETRQPVVNPAIRALRDGDIVELASHSLLIAKDSTERPIDDCAAPIRNAKGEVAGVVLIFRDVSERRRQERMVEDALAYADNIIATLREPFLVLDQTLRVVTANRSFYETFHVEPDETQGRFVYDLGNRQWDIPKLRTLLEEVLPQNHDFRDFEVEHNFSTVGWKVMLLNAHRIRKPGNQSELILLAIEDITARQRAHQLLEVSEIRFRRLFEASHDGILILDAASLKITHVNPFLTDLLDYPAEYFLGKELWEIGLLSDKAASRTAMQQLDEHGSIRYENLPLEDRHGHRHPVEMVANVHEQGRQPVIQCNIRDITERSRLEKLLRGQAAELSDLHRRKDEFLAMLSHELRSPLAPIANAVQLLGLQRETESRIQQQARGIIERQLGLLQHLVDDLLEVSRITTGRVQLRRERVAVSSVVEVALETVRPLLEQRRHKFTVVQPIEPIWLFADGSRLEQVMVNLLTNAAKYTEEGGCIEIQVSVEQQDKRDEWRTVVEEVQEQRAEKGAGSGVVLDIHNLALATPYAVIRVRDTGVGIAASLLPRIFDLFTQSERSLDRSQGGLGIGLALVQRLTELHGGQVEVCSVVGQGSEFIVRLPKISADALRPESLVAEATPPITRPLRVLVVDDNVDTVLSFSMLLRALGHDVRPAHDGLMAVRLASEYRPDVILLDIGLPGLNGYEVAKRVRQNPTLRNILLVALTGYGQEADRQISVEAGFNHHLVKPARLDQIQQILATVVPRAN